MVIIIGQKKLSWMFFCTKSDWTDKDRKIMLILILMTILSRAEVEFCRKMLYDIYAFIETHAHMCERSDCEPLRTSSDLCQIWTKDWISSASVNADWCGPVTSQFSLKGSYHI